MDKPVLTECEIVILHQVAKLLEGQNYGSCAGVIRRMVQRLAPSARVAEEARKVQEAFGGLLDANR